jgi:hypothetical protein
MQKPEIVRIRSRHPELPDHQEEIYQLDVCSLRQALELPDKLLAGFLLGRSQGTASGSHDVELAADELPALVYTQGQEEAFRNASTAWLTAYVDRPQVRTALTRENLLTWANNWVAKNPTYKEHTGWDQEKAESVYSDLPNTAAHELALLLQEHSVRSFEDYSSSDAKMTLADYCWDGCKGYKNYSEDEALDEIMSDLVDPDNSPYEFNDLEDLLEQLGPDDEE